MSEKYWAIHGGSDSVFAAKNLDDANDLVLMFNSIAKEYCMPESSRVQVVSKSELSAHAEHLHIRLIVGDGDYLTP